VRLRNEVNGTRDGLGSSVANRECGPWTDDVLDGERPFGEIPAAARPEDQSGQEPEEFH
jgi:hypothetical protein